MVRLQDVKDALLQEPLNATAALTRSESHYTPLQSFTLDKQRSYKQQYGDMYFLRLTKIKPAVEAVAAAAWDGISIHGETPKNVERVLDVRQGELCWITGTVYMDMTLKPNILEDVSKDRWLSAPITSQKYYSDDGSDQIMLEDESGRVRLVGDQLKSVLLVTGCIIAVLGTENASGEFVVLDHKFPDLPPQPARWALSRPADDHNDDDDDAPMADAGSGNKIAIVSGLCFSGTDASYDLELALLLEYLLGEALGPAAQGAAAHISRLVIAGDSVSMAADHRPDRGDDAKKAAHKKYGYDASAYNPRPSQLLDDFLAELLPSIPVTLLPGAKDPANASYPQQPIHTAVFARSRVYAAGPAPAAPANPATQAQAQAHGWFHAVTNPFEAEIEGWRVLGTGGQNVDDVFKYVDSDDRLGMMEAMCRWRCTAPTAPDTLWSYPFQEDDPFVMQSCPHVYFVGCQPEFATRVVDGPDGQRVRLIAVPEFARTKELVLLDTETLEVSRVKIEAR
ncbi:DNA polymerase delta small subunit [Escovopsis weberi]|uniref:DNA-directed DNA polymerase n=1 Tax=Escovopsis weberi TaxID=150374 RepID=A0A0M8MSJ3_ESCWE|nr:DNA polymerase delta small subunit [Escovopsis weberi]